MHSEMTKLYNNVIDDFMTLVEKQYKGKNVFSNDGLDKMKKSLKSKIKDTENFNKKIIKKFFDEAISFAQQPLTKQANKITDNTSVKLQQNFPAVQMCPLSLKKSNSQQQEDDLNQFKKQKNSKISQKQANKQIFQSLKFNEDDLFQFDEADLDQKLTSNELNSIKQKTGLHILGEYNTKQKKFNSKKQQTRFTVYNALLKIEGHDQQILFPVVELVAKRTSKSKLPI